MLPKSRRDKERSERIEEWLDKGMGCCALRNSEAAAFVQNTLLHFDGQRYRMMAWVLMPNHVHVLIEAKEPMAKIIQAWKSFSARWLLANNQRLRLGLPDPHNVWMREYWDRFIRDERHLASTFEYIHDNPVKAGLCARASDWPWSSARVSGSAGIADVLVGKANEDANVPPVGCDEIGDGEGKR
ncbi:MAG: REP-associated tyrosine transposase [Verrucomicrobiales bacterium]